MFAAYRLSGRAGTGEGTIDRPDEAGQFAGDGGDSDGWALALPDQRPVSRGEAMLRLSGDLANSARDGGDPRQLRLTNARRMPIASGTLDQHVGHRWVLGSNYFGCLNRQTRVHSCDVFGRTVEIIEVFEKLKRTVSP
jgi:hypothetical protein